MKPKFSSKFRSQNLVGASLITAVTICFTSSAFAVDNFWQGNTSTDWNTASNWSLGRVPINPNGATTGDTFDDAVINIPSPVATISANVPIPRDFRVGQGADTNGRLDHVAGDASTGGGNWMFVGRDGGTGIYNLANTAATGGTLTGYGQGSGNMTIPGGARLYVGGQNGAGGGTGTANINTSGTLNINNDLAVGSGGGTGVVNLDAGTITTGGWNFIGKDEGAPGGVGTLKISGGTLTNNGARTFIGRGNCEGHVIMSGGTYNNLRANDGDTFFAVGMGNLAHLNNSTMIMTGGTLNAATKLSVGGITGGNAIDTGPGKGTLNINGETALVNATGELWVGQGTGSVGAMTLDAGTIQSGSWVAIGRGGGNGTVDVNGGSWTKGGGTNTAFIVGSSGPGTLNISGGLVNVAAGETWLGEDNLSNFNMISGEFRGGVVRFAKNGASISNAFLYGGTMKVAQITGGAGTENIHFDGTEIVATGIQANFITDIGAGQASLDSNGLKINSNGFNIGSTHSFTGIGGVTKLGAGTLTLGGASSYSGENTVSAGKLAVTTANTNSGGYTVENGATLGIRQTSNTSSLVVSNATFDNGSVLDLDLGNFAGNATVAPLDVTGSLQVSGTVTINITDSLPATGTIKLVSFASGSGANFVLGSLPNGVVATLVKSAGLVSLDVTSASTPLWKGYVNAVWDTDTANWLEQVTNTPNSKYSNPAPVLFNDTASATRTSISLPGTVTPSKVTFNNTDLGYSISGAGKISGTGSLLKQGTGSLAILTTNDYTGTSTFEGGSTSVDLLANGGSPSSIGASTAAASNLVLAGGTLNYSGSSVSINRGFTVGAANSTISVSSGTSVLATSGEVVSTIGSFIKAGEGGLTLTNPGVNTLGTSGLVSRVNAGTLTLDGTGGTQVNNILGELWTGTLQGVSSNLVLTNTTLNVGSWIAMGRGNGTTGADASLTATNSTISCVNFSTGFDAGIALNDSDQFVTLNNTTWTNTGTTALAESLGSDTTMTLNNSTYTSGGSFRMAPGPNSSASLTISGTSSVTINAQFQMALNVSSSTNVTIQNSASLTKTGGWLSIGNDGTGVMTVKDTATLTADGDFNVGDVGKSKGTLNIQGSAVVTSTGGAVLIGKGSDSEMSGVLNLDGGKLIARRITGENAGGSSTFNFNGGVLQVGAGFNEDFMTGLDNVVIKAGGATIDTGANSVSINQGISEDATGHTLTKLGTGRLLMNTISTYTGTTSVTAGTLGGIGKISGPVSIGATAEINPGVTTGALMVDSLSFANGGKLTIDIGTSDDTVEVLKELNISQATLVINGTPTKPVYVIAKYNTLTGTQFLSTPVLPAGYSIDYAYSGNQIAIKRNASEFETWITGYFPNDTDPAIIGAAADPDGDGNSNILEFALGGLPNSGSDGPKVYHIEADGSVDPGTDKELLMTIAVRGGTPAFSTTTSPSATKDGVTYTIQGSTDLSGFAVGVTGVNVVAPEANPNPPEGYEYRTFSLNGSDNLPNKGFLRVKVE